MKIKILELLKNGISSVCAKYINDKDEIEYLPIFYIAGSQTLPPPLPPEEEQELIEQLSKEINNTEKKTTDLSQFISNVKKYTEITELTPEILNELIEKILIHQAEKIDGKKVQEIDIYYIGVGIISFPVSLEDMTMVIEKMLNKKISA